MYNRQHSMDDDEGTFLLPLLYVILTVSCHDWQSQSIRIPSSMR